MNDHDIRRLKARIERTEDAEDKAQAKLELGEAYEGRDEYDKAIAVYEELLESKDSPGFRTRLLLGVGRAYEGRGEHEEALKWYKEVLSSDKSGEDRLSAAHAAIFAGQIEYDSHGDIDEGLRFFKIAESEMRSDENLLDTMTQSHLLGRIGVAYYDKKQYSKGIEYLTLSIQLDRQLGRKDVSLYSSYHILGLCYDYLGDRKKTIGALEEIVNEYKEYEHILEVYRYLADSCWNIRDYRKCAKYLELMLQMGSEEPRYEYALGVSYHLLRSYDKAKLHLRRFLEMGSEDQEQIEHAERILAGRE